MKHDVSDATGPILRRVQRLVVLAGLILFVTCRGASAQSGVDTSVDLELPAALTIVDCDLTVAAGSSIDGNMNDCVIGGSGARVFAAPPGSAGGTIAIAGGGSLALHADGTFTFIAGPMAEDVLLPFVVSDATTAAPLAGTMLAHVYAPIQIATPTFNLPPGTTITGDLNDYVTGGVGPRTFGPVGVNITTPGGGTLTINADGTFVYTAPATGGTDWFTFTVMDSSVSAPLMATVTIAITSATTTPTTATATATATMTAPALAPTTAIATATTTEPAPAPTIATTTTGPAPTPTTTTATGPATPRVSVPTKARPVTVTRLPSTGAGTNDGRTIPAMATLLVAILAILMALAARMRHRN